MNAQILFTMKNYTPIKAVIACCTIMGLNQHPMHASSHREAPGITKTPKIDAADFYIFNSYESGREDYVTIVATYQPLQDGGAGPNYYMMDESARYEIHVDHSGDAHPDLTFTFQFNHTSKDISLDIGNDNEKKSVAVPVINVGTISSEDTGALNVIEEYSLTLFKDGSPHSLMNADTGNHAFIKPVDYIGEKSIPDYASYASSHIYNFNIPDCDKPGRVFVGQRRDPFVVNLGETFDLVNISTSPLGPEDANKNSLANKNVTALVLEIPKECLIGPGGNPVIAAWTTASLPKIEIVNGLLINRFEQVSRLGMPLVNEVVIGLKDKNHWNSSIPSNDTQFLDYVTHPTLPAILEILYGDAGVKAPTLFPRNDLVAVFLTGVEDLNQDGSVAEMVRLNTSIPAVPANEQHHLGVVGGDLAGFPNGRRLGDDVVDVALRVVMGALLPEEVAPNKSLPFTDGAHVNATMFHESFPYLMEPTKGSPNDPTITLLVEGAPDANAKFKPLRASFDPDTQSLKTDRMEGKSGFFRLKSDRESLEIKSVEIDAEEVNMGIGFEKH